MIIESFLIDVYNYKVDIIIARKDRGDSEEAYKKAMENFNLPDDFMSEELENFEDGGWGGKYIIDKTTRTACIVIHNCNNASKVAEVLTHEMDHIRNFIMKKHGLKGSETSAYLMGYIAKKVLPLVLRMK